MSSLYDVILGQKKNTVELGDPYVDDPALLKTAIEGLSDIRISPMAKDFVARLSANIPRFEAIIASGKSLRKELDPTEVAAIQLVGAAWAEVVEKLREEAVRGSR